MFCLRNQDITDAKAFFYLFFMSNSGYHNFTPRSYYLFELSLLSVLPELLRWDMEDPNRA